MSDFNTIVTKLAAIAKVTLVSIQAPAPNRGGFVTLATAEDAQVFAVALNTSSVVNARYASYKGIHYVFIG